MLVRVHFNQISHDVDLLDMLEKIKDVSQASLQSQYFNLAPQNHNTLSKDVMGYNLAGLQMLQRHIREAKSL